MLNSSSQQDNGFNDIASAYSVTLYSIAELLGVLVLMQDPPGATSASASQSLASPGTPSVSSSSISLASSPSKTVTARAPLSTEAARRFAKCIELGRAAVMNVPPPADAPSKRRSGHARSSSNSSLHDSDEGSSSRASSPAPEAKASKSSRGNGLLSPDMYVAPPRRRSSVSATPGALAPSAARAAAAAVAPSTPPPSSASSDGRRHLVSSSSANVLRVPSSGQGRSSKGGSPRSLSPEPPRADEGDAVPQVDSPEVALIRSFGLIARKMLRNLAWVVEDATVVGHPMYSSLLEAADKLGAATKDLLTAARSVLTVYTALEITAPKSMRKKRTIKKGTLRSFLKAQDAAKQDDKGTISRAGSSSQIVSERPPLHIRSSSFDN